MSARPVAITVTVVAVACGRFGFESPHPSGDAPNADAARDAAMGPTPIMWFPLDEPTGATTFADVVSGDPGTCTGSACPAMVAGHVSSAQHFDGIAQCITVADAGQANPVTFTISMWMIADIAGKGTMIGKRVDIGASMLNTWQVQMSTTRQVDFTYTVAGAEHSASSGSGALAVGVWHHLAASFDPSAATLYLDGVAVGSSPTAGASLTYDSNVASIGCETKLVQGEFFPGTLDEVQVYDRALSAAEIAALAGQ